MLSILDFSYSISICLFHDFQYHHIDIICILSMAPFLSLSCLFGVFFSELLRPCFFMQIVKMYYLKPVGALIFETVAFNTSKIMNPFTYGLYSVHVLTQFLLCCYSLQLLLSFFSKTIHKEILPLF